MSSPLSERLSFILDTVNGGAVVNELQRIGGAGETSQTRLQQKVGDTEKAFDRQGRAGGTALAVVSDGASKSTTMLGRMSERLGITESTLRTGIATAAAVGFGVLISKAADAVNQYVELAGQVRTFQRASGASAEEASKFVAVLDDLQISAEQGAASIGKLARVDPAKLEAFGVQVARASDGTVSLTETLLNVADAYAATEDPQQRALLGNAAFGRSYQQLIPLLEQGRAGLKAYFDGVSEGQILSQEQLNQARQYELALDNMQDAMGDLSRAAGEELVPALTGLLNAGAAVLGFLGDIPGPLVESAVAAGVFAVASVQISKGLNAIRASRAAETLSATASNMTGLAGAATAAAGPTDKLGKTAGSLAKVGVAGAALGAAIPILSEFASWLRSLAVEEPDVDRLATSLEYLGTVGSTSGLFGDMGGIDGFKKSLSDVLELQDATDSFLAKWNSMDLMAKALDQGTENIQSMDEALSSLVKGGQSDAAAQAFEQLAAAAEQQGVPIEKLRELFPQYASAVEDVALSQESAATATDGHSEAVSAAQEQVDKYAQAMERLQKAFDDLNGRQMSQAEADIAARDAMADFTTTVQENVKAQEGNALSLDRNTQAGRDNESGLLDQIKAAQDLATATAEQTGSTEAGRQAFETQIGAIRDNMLALGFNEQQVDALISTYGRVPSNVSTVTTVRDEATGQLVSIRQTMDDLDGTVATVTVRQRFITARTEDVPLYAFDPHRAGGGAVEAGGQYVVGEVRPELFRPAVPGTILPNTGAASSTSGRRDTPLMNVQGDLVVRDDRDIDRLMDGFAWAARTGGGT